MESYRVSAINVLKKMEQAIVAIINMNSCTD